MSLIFPLKVFLIFVHVFANSVFIVGFTHLPQTNIGYLCWDICWLQPSCFTTLRSHLTSCFCGAEAVLRNRLQIRIKQLSNFMFGFS